LDVSELAQLSAAQKRAVLTDLLRKKGEKATGGTLPAVPVLAAASDSSRDWLMTAAQRAMWLLQQLEPQSPVFVIAFAARFAAPPDVTAFRKSIAALVSRHPNGIKRPHCREPSVPP